MINRIFSGCAVEVVWYSCSSSQSNHCPRLRVFQEDKGCLGSICEADVASHKVCVQLTIMA